MLKSSLVFKKNLNLAGVLSQFVIKLSHFVITVAFCNKTVAFCNKSSNAFCNKFLSHFVIK